MNIHQWLHKFEEKFKTQLPIEYYNWIEKNLGKEIVLDNTTWRILSPHSEDGLAYTTERFRKWPGFPEKAVTIASDAGGNQLVFKFDPRTEKLGKTVFIWDHESGALYRGSENLESITGT